jgi:hypothetical protein
MGRGICYISSIMEHIESTNEPPPEPPRKRLSQLVGEEVAAQRQAADMAAYEEAAMEEPHWDRKTATSNFAKRVSARVQIAMRQ